MHYKSRQLFNWTMYGRWTGPTHRDSICFNNLSGLGYSKKKKGELKEMKPKILFSCLTFWVVSDRVNAAQIMVCLNCASWNAEKNHALRTVALSLNIPSVTTVNNKTVQICTAPLLSMTYPKTVALVKALFLAFGFLVNSVHGQNGNNLLLNIGNPCYESGLGENADPKPTVSFISWPYKSIN